MPTNNVGGPAVGNQDSLITITGISVSDPDSGPSTDEITVHLSVNHGTLTIRTDVAGGITAADITGGGNGTRGITLTATQDQINATLAASGGLTYQGDPGFTGSDGLTVSTYNGVAGDAPTFTPIAVNSTLIRPHSSVAGDINGDGILDIAFIGDLGTPVVTDRIGIRLGNGDGSFGPTTDLVTGGRAIEVALADLDGDRDLDLVFVNWTADGAPVEQAGAGVRYNDGVGNFGATQLLANLPEAYDVSVADLNGDGRMDVVVGQRSLGTIVVLLASGAAGSFAPPVTYAATTDFLRMDSAIVGDFTGDGRPEIIIFNFGDRLTDAPPGTVTMLTNTGDGTFGAPVDIAVNQPQPFDGAADDLNGDGHLDLVFGTHGSFRGLTVMLGNGDGTFQAGVRYAAVDFPINVSIGDVNGDGRPDLVSGTANGGLVAIFVGNGDGTFRPRVDLPTDSYFANNTTLGDFDRDGDFDIFVNRGFVDGQGVFLNQTLSRGDVDTKPITVNAATPANVIDGTPGDDVLVGTAGDDIFNGLGGNDQLFGLQGNDVLNGGDGSDALHGGAGTDTYDGGAGAFDAVFFNNAFSDDSATQGVIADIRTQTILNDGFGNVETMTGIEGFGSGTRFSDVFYGDDGANGFVGGTGDYVHGFGGDDFVNIEGAPALIDGGDGQDAVNAFRQARLVDSNGDGIAEWEYTTNGVHIDLSLGRIVHDGFGGSGLLVSVENIVGSAGDDTLIGDNGDGFIMGSGGNDLLVGRGGNDLLMGGGGNDLLRGDGFNNYNGPSGDDIVSGGAGDDIMWTSAGVDSYDGGDGFDRVSFFSLAATQAAVASLITQTIDNDGFGNSETMLSIEALGAGTVFADELTGDDNANFLVGDRGDTLVGNGGHDTFQLGGAPALTDGGSGIDAIVRFTGDIFGSLRPDSNGDGLAELVFATRGVHVDLSLGMIVDDGFGNSGTLVSIENVGGSDLDDMLIGDDGVNGLNGFEGNDLLEGRAGNDVFQGGGGDDVMIGGLGGDILQGGDGSDTASYAFATGGMEVFLFDGLSGYSNGPDGHDTLIDVENVTGSQFDDDIAGNSLANVLRGLGGHDFITGGSGDDVIDGGDGRDQASYHDAGDGVNASLTAGTASGAAGNDTLVSIEDLSGSSFDDHLIGDGEINSLNGLAGNDMLEGLGGHDALRGRQGNDTLRGGDGDDFLDGGQGDDVIDGSDGFDRAAFFSMATTGVTVDLNLQGVAQNTNQGMDTLIGIEHVSGTRFDDVLIGNAGDNWLRSGVGTDSDIISGGGGNDLIEVGGGTHTLDGGDGNDTLSLIGNTTDITMTGVTVSLALQGVGQDTEQGIMTVSGFENLSGSIHDDRLTGDGAANVLAGDEGADQLAGADGNDVLLGDGRTWVDFHGTGGSGPITTDQELSNAFGVGAGNDVLDGGRGDDLLVGGGGDDILNGGVGRDIFAFGPGSGHDRITDFTNVQDKIKFESGFGVGDFSDLLITEAGKGVLITWGDGSSSILLEKTNIRQIGASDFIFGDDAPGLAMLAFEARAIELADAHVAAHAWLF